jgi:hypothetical protein
MGNNEFSWTATRYSDVFRMDRRAVAQALAGCPSQTVNGRVLYAMRDAAPALFDSARKNPAELQPKEALDFYRAKREQLKLESDIAQMVRVDAAQQSIATACAALDEVLTAIPAKVAMDCSLPPPIAETIKASLAVARNVLHENLLSALTPQRIVSSDGT